MEGKQKQSTIFNAAAVLLLLSAVGGTPRFMVISLTLLSWLQGQWLQYTSHLKERRATRLAAAAAEARTQHRKQVADISALIGESVISSLDERHARVLTLSQEAERRRHDQKQVIMKRVMAELVEFHQSRDSESAIEKGKLKAHENDIAARERELETREKALQEKLDKRETARKQKQQKALESSVAALNSTPAFPPVEITLPGDLLEYEKDLSTSFTCIGTTQRGTRCGQWMISDISKSAAARRIRDMKSPDPKAALFEENALRELADWMLCPLWHRNRKPQGDQIANRWYYQLSSARAQLKAGSQRNGLTSSAASTPSTVASSVFSSGNVSRTGTPMSGYHSMSPPGAAAGRLFQGSAAQDLTPKFEAIARLG